MSNCARLFIVLLSVAIALTSHGAGDWSVVKQGLTPAQAEAALGQPLVRTYGRGFEVWIYDSQGEIIFAGGPAIGWTLPVPNAESAARSVEGDVLIRPVRRLPAWRGVSVRNNQTVGPSEIRFRYKQ